MDRVLTCMVTDQLAAGSLNHDLTGGISAYIGLEGGVALSSYYGALALAVESLDLASGAGVITSALAPAVYLDVMDDLGLVPLIADVDPGSGSVSVEDARRQAALGAAAVLVHHTLGFIPDMEGLAALGLPMVEDLSQGLGGFIGEKRCGTFGGRAVISLDPKGIVTAGGGAVALSADRSAVRRLQAAGSAVHQALSDFNASLGLAQIREIEGFIAARKQIAAAYARGLQRTRHRTLVQEGEADNVYYSFPVVVESGAREVRQYARRKGVETAAAYEDTVLATLLSREDAAEPSSPTECPNARALLMRCLLFPLYPTLGKTRVEEVVRVLTTLP